MLSSYLWQSCQFCLRHHSNMRTEVASDRGHVSLYHQHACKVDSRLTSHVQALLAVKTCNVGSKDRNGGKDLQIIVNVGVVLQAVQAAGTLPALWEPNFEYKTSCRLPLKLFYWKGNCSTDPLIMTPHKSWPHMSFHIKLPLESFMYMNNNSWQNLLEGGCCVNHVASYCMKNTFWFPSWSTG